MSWQQDYPLIVAAVNRVTGTEVRALEYMHWWTFIAAYTEIGGECVYAQVVHIREKLAAGEKLEKYERTFYNKNAARINLKTAKTAAEEKVFSDWGV